jgi:hypothetical protein
MTISDLIRELRLKVLANPKISNADCGVRTIVIDEQPTLTVRLRP